MKFKLIIQTIKLYILFLNRLVILKYNKLKVHTYFSSMNVQ